MSAYVSERCSSFGAPINVIYTCAGIVTVAAEENKFVACWRVRTSICIFLYRGFIRENYFWERKKHDEITEEIWYTESVADENLKKATSAFHG